MLSRIIDCTVLNTALERDLYNTEHRKWIRLGWVVRVGPHYYLSAESYIQLQTWEINLMRDLTGVQDPVKVIL